MIEKAHSGFSKGSYSSFQFALKSGQEILKCVQVQAFNGNWIYPFIFLLFYFKCFLNDDREGLPVANLNSYGGYPTSSAWKVYSIIRERRKWERKRWRRREEKKRRREEDKKIRR